MPGAGIKCAEEFQLLTHSKVFACSCVVVRAIYLAFLLVGRVSMFLMSLARLIVGQSRTWSDHYLFSGFNALKRQPANHVEMH